MSILETSDPINQTASLAAQSSQRAIKRLSSPRPTLLAFEISAKIAKADIEDMARQVELAFDTYDKIDMLLIMAPFEGMDAGAAFDPEAMGAQMRSIRHVRKYAVVGAPAWARTMIEFSDHLSPVDAKTFDLEDQQQAWTWIQEPPVI